ncbi:MAG: NUDIX domain-containing protein, partial [Pseudomonadota bacterium]
MTDLIDAAGYRANVGMIVANEQRQVLWAGRKGRSGWQFPQGGIGPDETPEQAM